MRAYRYNLADVFTDRPLAGNQLAVFRDAPADPALMQAIAREMNLSETVFLTAPEDGADLTVRMFSTVREIPFAGHPLLGTAALAAFHDGARDERVLRVGTAGGVVPVRVTPVGRRRFHAWMRQPVPTVAAWKRPEGLVAALGLRDTGELPVEVYDNGLLHVYVAAPSTDAVAELVPDLPALARLVGDVHVNCFAGRGDQWTTRMFSPLDFVPEDPACGSAAGPLAVHLVRHGRLAPGRKITIAQGAQVGRPSVLHAIAEGGREQIDAVHVGGSVCVLGTGELTL
ncbi:PhzF family phenazine biosynthesis protein [Yinghuangia sp. ASG 101]|uniref:PhzF family phenazine biosynthesis protein n=1 Tax=Yinghuangia sp. ASG 101 TaxID=2896848 RepID=UPI001E54845F|nr:PhzF family phenazine biosynthesis protein [Yinghuangia sp. ASG 101]UGQ13680.1 PhzF family phenazine biosynthesis protein [Yinghuangia sp. ASG 101]